MSNYVHKVKKGIMKIIYDKICVNCSAFRKMQYEVGAVSNFFHDTLQILLSLFALSISLPSAGHL
jgi:hypothetical protein